MNPQDEPGWNTDTEKRSGQLPPRIVLWEITAVDGNNLTACKVALDGTVSTDCAVFQKLAD
jgi:hypothetical protein